MYLPVPWILWVTHNSTRQRGLLPQAQVFDTAVELKNFQVTVTSRKNGELIVFGGLFFSVPGLRKIATTSCCIFVLKEIAEI